MLRLLVIVAVLLTGFFQDRVVAPTPSALPLEQTPITVGDDLIRAAFDPQNGQLIQLDNLATGQKLVANNPPTGVPIFASSGAEKGKGRLLSAVVQSFDWH